jgi:hypothetical protein
LARVIGAGVLALGLVFTSSWFSQPAFGFTQTEKTKKGKKGKKASKEGEATTAETPTDPATSGSTAPDATADTTSKKGKGKGKKGKAEAASKAPAAKGEPILWESRGDVSQLNLFWGAGGEDLAPKPPFTFEKEDVTGTNPKVKIIDANGIKWNVKFDEEVHAEAAASRIAWACGYMVEESYFVASGRINGVSGLSRAKKFVGADGSFTKALFEKRPDTIARRNIRWSWDSNPFVGSKELSGLAILNTMLNNWDAKVDNNNVLGMYGDGNKVYDWYVQSDWGGTFGKTGGYFSHTKWDLKDFSKQAFIDRVSGGRVQLHYTGKMGSALKAVPVEHAKWFAGIVGQLSDDQIRDAFRAAGATDAEASGFTSKLRQKIDELKTAANQ